MEIHSTPFDRFDPFDSLALQPLSLSNKTPFDHLTRFSGMESIRLHLIDLIHSTHLLYSLSADSLSADATRHHLTILPGLVEWSSIRLHLIDLIHSTWSIWSTRLSRLTCFDSLAIRPECSSNKTPFDHLTRLSRMESIRLHLIDLIHSTHLLYGLLVSLGNKTPFDHLTRL